MLESRDIGTEKRHSDHVGRILNQHTGITMVRMVIIGPGTHDDIGLPFTNQSSDQAAVFQGGHQLPIMEVENLGGGAQAGGGLVYFRSAAFGQRPARIAPMANIAIGYRD